MVSVWCDSVVWFGMSRFDTLALRGSVILVWRGCVVLLWSGSVV